MQSREIMPISGEIHRFFISPVNLAYSLYTYPAEITHINTILIQHNSCRRDNQSNAGTNIKTNHFPQLTNTPDYLSEIQQIFEHN